MSAVRDHKATPAPWLAVPGRPLTSLFWRMGGGEDYLDAWMEWFRAASEAERRAYLEAFPPPESWALLIESVQS